MEIKYYELSYDDIAQISRMEQEFFSVPWSEASIAHYYEAGNTIFVVARSSEPWEEPGYTASGSSVPAAQGKKAPAPRRVVGYAAVFCAADEGNLVSIGVHRDYRRMGIAAELLDIVYEMAAGRGVASIHLEVRQSNLPAIELYERDGFTPVGRRPGFYRNPREDALIYVKQL